MIVPGRLLPLSVKKYRKSVPVAGPSVDKANIASWKSAVVEGVQLYPNGKSSKFRPSCAH